MFIILCAVAAFHVDAVLYLPVGIEFFYMKQKPLFEAVGMQFLLFHSC